MAIATYAALRSQFVSAVRVPAVKNATSGGIVSGTLLSLWKTSPFAGLTPGAAAATSNTTTGALPYGGGSTARLLGIDLISTTLQATTILVCDRLSHISGLSGTSVALQTTNLPTAALTRYTDGAGVMALVEVYNDIGAATQTATVSYTNQAGTSGRTGTVAIGGTGRATAQAVVPIYTEAGDTGVRSIESVQLAGSTGTPGNFGFTLFRPLALLPMVGPQGSLPTRKKVTLNGFLDMGTLPRIQSGACLWLLQQAVALASDVQSVLLVGSE